MLATILLFLQLHITVLKTFPNDGIMKEIPSYIVLHSTESCSSINSVLSYLRHSHKSYHYIIDRDGKIFQLLPTNMIGRHAGWSYLHGLRHFNEFSIGISFNNCDKQTYTDAQYNSATLLIQELQKQYPEITNSRIVTHHNISLFRGKSDPKNFDISRILTK